MVKRITLLFLILAVCMNSNFIFAAGQVVKVEVDSKSVVFRDAKPYIDAESGRVMVPVRFVAEALGSNVTWNPDNREVHIKKQGQSMILIIGLKRITVNAGSFTIDVAPIIKDGRTFVPVRFVGEALKCQVEWNSAAKTVIIRSVPAKSDSQTGVTAEEQAMLNLVNKARIDAGLKALTFDTALVKTARVKASDMVQNNYFSHDSPTYGSPFDLMAKFGIKYTAAGENIAMNSSVDKAFQAWRNSKGHRENILNSNFNYIGIGIVTKSDGMKVFVQQFIRK
jgi:uncharacterized YkwD family protein